jgi:plasmid stabilization system protein ParE
LTLVRRSSFPLKKYLQKFDISQRLGERFATVVERALAIAAEFPAMGAPYSYGTRRVFPKRFPFSVVYLHRDDEILVLAIAPDDRKPGYWLSRITDR